MRDPKVLIIMFLGLACSYLYFENGNLRQAAANYDNGYIALMDKQVKGKPLASYVRSDSVGVFKINERMVACAIVKDLD